MFSKPLWWVYTPPATSSGCSMISGTSTRPWLLGNELSGEVYLDHARNSCMAKVGVAPSVPETSAASPSLDCSQDRNSLLTKAKHFVTLSSCSKRCPLSSSGLQWMLLSLRGTPLRALWYLLDHHWKLMVGPTLTPQLPPQGSSLTQIAMIRYLTLVFHWIWGWFLTGIYL